MTDKMTDMTTGSPVKHILAFTWPLLIGNIFQQLYNVVDSIIVGRFVGKDALAAVGACGSLNFLFFSLSLGLATGVGILVSQYYGARNDDLVSKTIANSIYVLSVVSILISVVGTVFTPAFLSMLDTPQEIMSDAVIYLRTTCAGMIFIAVYNGVASILRALGDSKTPLYFLIISGVVNVVLDLLFVIVWRMGVFGVAFATVISQVVAAVASVIYAYKKISYFHLKRSQMSPDWGIIGKSFRLGMPVALQNSMIAISCIVLQRVVNGFGTTVIATFTITGRIEQIVQQPYGSLGIALTTYAGQNMGAGKKDRVVQGFKKGSLIMLAFTAVIVPVMFFLGRYIVGIFVDDVETIVMGAKALKITSICYFGLGMIYVPRAILNGYGDTIFSFINGLTEVACRIGFSQLLMRIPFFGYWSVWATNGFTWAVTAVVCVIRFARGKWKNKAIIN